MRILGQVSANVDITAQDAVQGADEYSTWTERREMGQRSRPDVGHEGRRSPAGPRATHAKPAQRSRNRGGKAGQQGRPAKPVEDKEGEDGERYFIEYEEGAKTEGDRSNGKKAVEMGTWE